MGNLAWLLQQSAPANPLLNFLPLLLIVGIFYFLVFMPMQRQKKQQAEMLAKLAAGAEVLTTGGILGTIVSIAGDSVGCRAGRPPRVARRQYRRLEYKRGLAVRDTLRRSGLQSFSR